MPKVHVISLVAGVLALGVFVSRGSSAPADKGVRFEYGEIEYSDVTVFPRGQPGQPQPGVRRVTARWTTSGTTVEGAGWADLGDKLKAPAADKDASEVALRLRVLDRLGADGWEVYARTAGPSGQAGNWSLKRRVP